MESKSLYTVTITVRLKKDRERTLKADGVWIYDNEIDTITGECENGDLAATEDSDGYGLGHGFINTNSKLTARILPHKKNTVIGQNFIEMQARNVWEYGEATVNISSCRILFGEAGLLLGIVIDRPSDMLMVESLVLRIDWLGPVIVEMLKRTLAEDGIITRGAYGCSDVKVRLQEGMERYKGFIEEPFGTKVEILENEVHYLVDVEDGQETRFFSDQKYSRLAVQNLCRRIQSDRVLDCFTHTGSSALNAGLVGPKDVLDVDASRLAMDQASENAALNGIQDRVHFECVDVFDLLPKLEQDGQKSDVTILDPPVFTKSGNSIKDAVKGCGEVDPKGMKLVKGGGYLTTYSRSHSMDPELLTRTIRGAAGNIHKQPRQVEYYIQASDHPILWTTDESYYPKPYIFQVYNEK